MAETLSLADEMEALAANNLIVARCPRCGQAIVPTASQTLGLCVPYLESGTCTGRLQPCPEGWLESSRGKLATIRRRERQREQMQGRVSNLQRAEWIHRSKRVAQSGSDFCVVLGWCYRSMLSDESFEEFNDVAALPRKQGEWWPALVVWLDAETDAEALELADQRQLDPTPQPTPPGDRVMPSETPTNHPAAEAAT